jgi:hypothetical protein
MSSVLNVYKGVDRPAFALSFSSTHQIRTSSSPTPYPILTNTTVRSAPVSTRVRPIELLRKAAEALTRLGLPQWVRSTELEWLSELSTNIPIPCPLRHRLWFPGDCII